MIGSSPSRDAVVRSERWFRRALAVAAAWAASFALAADVREYDGIVSMPGVLLRAGLEATLLTTAALVVGLLLPIDVAHRLWKGRLVAAGVLAAGALAASAESAAFAVPGRIMVAVVIGNWPDSPGARRRLRDGANLDSLMKTK